MACIIGTHFFNSILKDTTPPITGAPPSEQNKEPLDLSNELKSTLDNTGKVGRAAVQILLGNVTYLAMRANRQVSTSDAQALSNLRAEQLARSLDPGTRRQIIALTRLIEGNREVFERVDGEQVDHTIRRRQVETQSDSSLGGDITGALLSEPAVAEVPRVGDRIFEQTFKPGEYRDYGEIDFHQGIEWSDRDRQEVARRVLQALRTTEEHTTEFPLSFGRVRLQSSVDKIDARKRFVTGELFAYSSS